MKRFTSLVVLTAFFFALLSQNLLMAKPQGSKYSLAVLNLMPSGSAISAMDARLLTSTLTDEISRTGLFYTMTQDNMEKGLLSKNIDPANCGEPRCALQAARALGVQVVVVGTITQAPEGFVVDAHLIHVTSREVVRSVREDYLGDFTVLTTRMSQLARKLVGRGGATAPTTAAPPRLPEPDFGRGYYDSNGGGFKWQYLGLGLLLAGGVGAGIYFAANGSDGGNNGGNPPPPPPPASQLPGPPTFP